MQMQMLCMCFKGCGRTEGGPHAAPARLRFRAVEEVGGSIPPCPRFVVLWFCGFVVFPPSLLPSFPPSLLPSFPPFLLLFFPPFFPPSLLLSVLSSFFLSSPLLLPSSFPPQASFPLVPCLVCLWVWVWLVWLWLCCQCVLWGWFGRVCVLWRVVWSWFCR